MLALIQPTSCQRKRKKISRVLMSDIFEDIQSSSLCTMPKTHSKEPSRKPSSLSASSQNDISKRVPKLRDENEETISLFEKSSSSSDAVPLASTNATTSSSWQYNNNDYQCDSLTSFKFSERSTLHPKDVASEKKFHRLVKQAVACSHVSSNYRDISLQHQPKQYPFHNQDPLCFSYSETVCDTSPLCHTTLQKTSSASFLTTSLDSVHPSSGTLSSGHAIKSIQSKEKCVPCTSSCSLDLTIKNNQRRTIMHPFQESLTNATPNATPAKTLATTPAVTDSHLNYWNAYEDFSDLENLNVSETSSSSSSSSQSPPKIRSSHLSQKNTSYSDNLSTKSTCAICLTDIVENDIIGELAECHHFFCYDCIHLWANRTNQCPLCKQKFYCILKKNFKANTLCESIVLSSIQVQDKTLHLTDDETYNIEPMRRPLEEYICQVCRLGNQEEVLLLCDGCDDAYHTFCVGCTEVPEGSWFCHTCQNSNHTMPETLPEPLIESRQMSRREEVPRENMTSYPIETRQTTRRRRIVYSPFLQQNVVTRRPITRSFSHRLQQTNEILNSLTPSNSILNNQARTRSAQRRMASLRSARSQQSSLGENIVRRWLNSQEALPSTGSTSNLILPPIRRQLRHRLMTELTWIVNDENAPQSEPISLPSVCSSADQPFASSSNPLELNNTESKDAQSQSNHISESWNPTVTTSITGRRKRKLCMRRTVYDDITNESSLPLLTTPSCDGTVIQNNSSSTSQIPFHCDQSTSSTTSYKCSLQKSSPPKNQHPTTSKSTASRNVETFERVRLRRRSNRKRNKRLLNDSSSDIADSDT
ncbi:PHD and RING finger domain-containing protein 1-like [Hylaeus volcanicus]|uniref:PHD and RING finger domain-containing protein 1-like n=1 Tax=Hylaeus volcanicus TaxID=313075 RepID=UPI0023B86214|nr:PHD and RING finger domain-containing protein 1-like [Hylaeus volcanicus]